MFIEKAILFCDFMYYQIDIIYRDYFTKIKITADIRDVSYLPVKQLKLRPLNTELIIIRRRKLR